MQSARLSVPPLNLGLSGRRTGACHPGVPLISANGLFPLSFPARIYFNPEGLFIFR